MENCISLIVVDNCSSDDSLGFLGESRYKDIVVQRNASNLGYARGVNSVLKKITSRYVAVLNPDCYMEDDWLNPLADFLDRNKDYAAASPAILLKDSPDRINALGIDVHISGIANNRYLGGAYSDQSCHDVFSIHGAAVVFNRALLVKIGGWPDHGFLYYEDVEISLLFRLMGYKLACLPEVKVFHDYRLSIEPKKIFYLERNRLDTWLTYHDTIFLLLISPLFIATEVFVILVFAIKGRSYFLAKLSSYRSLFRSRDERRIRRAKVKSLKLIGSLGLIKLLKFTFPISQIKGVVKSGVPRRKGLSEIPDYR